MLLKDYVMDQPIALLSGLLVWIPVSIWIISMVQWMIQGDMDVLSGFASCIVAFVLGFLTLKPPVPALAPLFLASALALVVMFPILQRGLEKRAHVMIDVESLQRSYEALDKKPTDFSARWRMIQVLHTRGLQGHAVAIGEELLKGADEQVFYEELRTIARWKDDLKADNYRALPCLECNYLNYPGQIYCKRCRGKYLLDYARGRWLGGRSLRRLIAVWVAAVAGLVGVPTAATSMDPKVAVFVVPLLLLISVLIIWRAFVGQKEADAA